MTERGRLIVVSGPSGAGKSTVIAKAMEKNKSLRFSVSATTRPPRPGETDGRDYFFVSEAEFLGLVENDLMLEHAQYVGNRYGTPREPVEKMLESGMDVILDIEVQGAAQVKAGMADCVTVFLTPRSFDELRRRLSSRGTDSEERIQGRLARAREELRLIKNYDYIVINDDPAEAAEELCSIITAEKCKTAARINLLEEC